MPETPDKADVYEQPDGRPALFIRPKFLGNDGDGFLFACEKGGIVVQAWVSESEVKAMKTWRPKVPAEISQRITELEGEVAELKQERMAWQAAMRAAVSMLGGERADQVREVFRRSRR